MQTVYHRFNIGDVIAYARQVWAFSSGAAAVSSQAHRVGFEAFSRNTIQETVVPTPCAVPGAADE
jgi:hypothetical protein